MFISLFLEEGSDIYIYKPARTVEPVLTKSFYCLSHSDVSLNAEVDKFSVTLLW